jgi:predicted transglutaminase-like cysteine proteinase
MVSARAVVGGVFTATFLLCASAAAAAASGAMVLGGYTSQPIGHYDFCQRYPEECSVRPFDYGPLRVTRTTWRLILDVNREVNQLIRPMSDLEIYGADEHWDFPGEVGDCEDYVLEKRRRLNGAGIPLSDLLVTVVRKTDGEGHAVLTVRTDRGDFILDNLTDRVRPWRQTGYWFLKRQAADHAGRWVAIDGINNPYVGSVD